MARAVLGSLDLLIIPLVVAWVCGAAFAANFRYVAVRALAGVILVSAVGVVEYFYMGLLVTTGANGYPAAPFDYAMPALYHQLGFWPTAISTAISTATVALFAWMGEGYFGELMRPWPRIHYDYDSP
jgi:hypothetical protein